MQLKSQEMRKLAPELDPLRIGTCLLYTSSQVLSDLQKNIKMIKCFMLWPQAQIIT